MPLASILQPTSVKVVSDVSSKKRLMQEIARIASPLTDVPENDIFTALLDRETLGPTGFGNGIALPHSRLEGLTGVTGVFLKLEHPIDFDAVDRKPVDLIFALFAPEEAGTQHLKALAMVSRTLRDDKLCEKLRGTSDPSAIYALLAAARLTQAA